MAKANVKNERVKRRFFKWLKEADGCCQATADNVEKALWLYEDFTRQEDFALLNADKAVSFKKWLGRRETNGKSLSLVTYHTYLRYLRKFFTWLCWQLGYKSRIRPDIVAYLRVSEKEERMATQAAPRDYPSLEYVLKLVNSISTATEVDRRDRALFAFTLLSGMRDKAIITLPLGCFDEAALTVNQNPRKGVQTKFAKLIPTTLFVFDQGLLDDLLVWVAHLKTKGFGSQAPLFPRSKPTQGTDGMSFESPSEVEPAYWRGTSGIRAVFKRRAAEAGLPYFPPHTFRHLAVDLALKACKTGEQIKAVSQNFGHEHVATSLSSYGNFDPLRLSEVVRSLDFSAKSPQVGSDKHLVEEMKKLLLANNDRML